MLYRRDEYKKSPRKTGSHRYYFIRGLFRCITMHRLFSAATTKEGADLYGEITAVIAYDIIIS